MFQNMDFFMHLIRSVKEGAFVQGAAAFVEDGQRLSQPWDFKLKDVLEPERIKFWYGTEDRNVPISMGRAMAKQLPGSKLFEMDETHLSLIVNHEESILREILEALEDLQDS